MINMSYCIRVRICYRGELFPVVLWDLSLLSNEN